MTSRKLQEDFRMTSGWLQGDAESFKQAFREHSEHSDQTEFREKESKKTSSYRRSLKYFVLLIQALLIIYFLDQVVLNQDFYFQSNCENWNPAGKSVTNIFIQRHFQLIRNSLEYKWSRDKKWSPHFVKYYQVVVCSCWLR